MASHMKYPVPGGARCRSCKFELCDVLQPDTRPHQRRLVRGQHLTAGTCRQLWIVLEGLVGLCTTLPDGRRQILSLALPDDVVCPAFGGDNAEVSIVALTPSLLCELDLGAAAAYANRDMPLSDILFRLAHRQMKAAATHLVTLGRLDGMERVCLFLTDMAWRSGRQTPDGWQVSLPLSREDMADYLGLNAETVSRILGRVKKSRLANFISPTEYIVPCMERLGSRAPLAAVNARRQMNGSLAKEIYRT